MTYAGCCVLSGRLYVEGPMTRTREDSVRDRILTPRSRLTHESVFLAGYFGTAGNRACHHCPFMSGAAVPASAVVPSVLLSSVEDLPADLPAVLDLLADAHPTIAQAMVRALAGASSPALRATADRLLEGLADEARLDAEVDAIVSAAVRAQQAFENWTEDRVDGLLSDLAMAFARRAEDLAVVAVEETGMGNVPDKAVKNRFASLTVYGAQAGKAAQGPLSFDARRRVAEIASPVGVIFAVLPVTSPVASAIFKTLSALKTRNALVLSFHHKARGIGPHVSGIIRDVLAAHGAPADVVSDRAAHGSKSDPPFHGDPRRSMVLATGADDCRQGRV